MHNWAGVGIDEFSHMKRWIDQIAVRPAAVKGSKVPHETNFDEPDANEKAVAAETQIIVTR